MGVFGWWRKKRPKDGESDESVEESRGAAGADAGAPPSATVPGTAAVAPGKTASSGVAFRPSEHSEDEMDQEIDDYFDAMLAGEGADLEVAEEGETRAAVAPGDAPPPGEIAPGVHVFDTSIDDFVRSEARELFASIAEQYVRPVKQFAKELSRGPGSREWLEICLPSIRMLVSSARSMGMDDTVPELERFQALLEESQNYRDAQIDGAEREGLMSAYGQMIRVLPDVFSLRERVTEGEIPGEGLLILSLLRQIPEVGRVTLDKLFAAGFTTLEILFAANPEDLVRTSNVSERVSVAVCSRMREYQREREATVMAQTEGAVKDRWKQFRDLVAELEDHHEKYSEAAKEWGAEKWVEAKRRHRRAREHLALKIEVVAIELGHKELVEKMQLASFDKRLQLLREVLKTAPG